MSAITELYSSFESNNEARNRRIFENTKKLNIAITLIDTYMAAQKAYASQMTLTPDAPIRAAIAAGIAVLSGLAKVNAIRNTKYGSSSAAVSPSAAGSVSGGGQSGNRADATFTPIAPQSFRRTRKGDTVKVVVVESEIREVTDRINGITAKAVVE